MAVYFIIYFLILISPQLVIRKRKGILQEDRQDRHTCFMMGLLILMFALRHQSMGADLGYGSSFGYLASFVRLSQYSWGEVIRLPSYLNYEKGYILFNKAISIISKDPQWLLVCCGLVSLIPIGIMIYRYSRDCRFSVIVFMGLPCFLIFFSGLRQGIAIGICCYAVCCLQERKKLKYAATMLLATLFHSSAIIFLVAYPLYYIRVKKSTRFFSILLLPVFFVFSRPLYAVFAKIFKAHVGFEETGAGTLFLIFCLVYCFCAVFVNEKDERSAGFLNLFYFACACQSVSGYNQLVVRVTYYFMIGLIIALPNIVTDMRDKNMRFLSSAGIQGAFIVYGLYAIYTSARPSWPMAYPYYFFWSEI